MIEMASDLDHLRKQQAEELAALKAAQKEEREMRKAQKSIKKSRAKQARTRARKAAKEAYPESNLILVWNGRPIAVREVERPAQIVRADNILPRKGQYIAQPVRSENILPRANYNILASQNARCSCGSGVCRGCGECASEPMASYNARPVGLDTILRYGTYVGGITLPDGDVVQFVLNDGSMWQIYLNRSFGDRVPSNTEIIRTAIRVERIDNDGFQAIATPKMPMASGKAGSRKLQALHGAAGRKAR